MSEFRRRIFLAVASMIRSCFNGLWDNVTSWDNNEGWNN